MTARNADTDAGVSSLNMASVRDFIADRHKFRCTGAAERSICWPHTQMSIGNEKDRIDRNAQGQAPNLKPPQGRQSHDSKQGAVSWRCTTMSSISAMVNVFKDVAARSRGARPPACSLRLRDRDRRRILRQWRPKHFASDACTAKSLVIQCQIHHAKILTFARAALRIASLLMSGGSRSRRFCP